MLLCSSDGSGVRAESRACLTNGAMERHFWTQYVAMAGLVVTITVHLGHLSGVATPIKVVDL